MRRITLTNRQHWEVNTEREPAWVTRGDWEYAPGRATEGSLLIDTADAEQLAAIQAVLRVGARCGYTTRGIEPKPWCYTLELVTVPTVGDDLFGTVTAVQTEDMGGWWRITATIAL